jgi:cellulose biosynthesis protein BcsQ
MEVFYLNMERFPATAAYFNGSGVQNLSNMLFYLKENNKNLALKIEGSRSVDPATGVHYFSPPENIFDTDDLNGEELDRLLNQFKSMGFYDRLVIDIPSDLSSINISILEKSDTIFLVLPCSPLSGFKADTMLKGFEILEKRRGIRFLRNWS